MLAGEYEDQQAVLRIKTDIKHKDPALRDWGAFRIRKMSHPRPEIGNKYIVWPLLDFAGAIERLVRNRELWQHISKGGRRLVEERYSADRMYHQLEQMLSGLTALERLPLKNLSLNR